MAGHRKNLVHQRKVDRPKVENSSATTGRATYYRGVQTSASEKKKLIYARAKNFLPPRMGKRYDSRDFSVGEKFGQWDPGEVKRENDEILCLRREIQDWKSYETLTNTVREKLSRIESEIVADETTKKSPDTSQFEVANATKNGHRRINQRDTENCNLNPEVREEVLPNDEDEQWEDVECFCILCDKLMDPCRTCVVKERAIRTLIVSSKRRKDKKHERLEGLKRLSVHKNCQIIYSRENNIKMAEKALKERNIMARRRKQDGRAFDFSINCFFCNVPFNRYNQKYKRVSAQYTIDNIIEQLKIYPKDETKKTILSRVCNLGSFDDEYYKNNEINYHAKCFSKFYVYRATNARGRPISNDMSDLVSFVINYILDNDEECQFSLKSILQEYTKATGTNEFPRLDRIIILLKRHFDDEIVVHNVGSDKLISFKNTLGKGIEDSWYDGRKKNLEQEKLRIVDLAAHIILQDIRAMKYETNSYKSPSTFLNDLTKDFPESLRLFLDILIKTHKKSPGDESEAQWDKKIVTVAHALMSLARPKSFLSPLLLALSTMINKKYAAKYLIDCLNNIGLCASYTRTSI